MIGQTIYTFFNSLYDKTYPKTVLYITKKCDDPAQVSDITQEVYTEVYTVLLNKGYEHLQSPEAFVMHIAKKKLAKYYGFKTRFLSCMSLFSFNSEDEEEFEAPISDSGELSLEDKCEAKQLYFQLCQHLKSKDAVTQKIFLLYYSLDLPLKQIAAELKISEGTVKNKLYRAVRELKTIYGKDGDNNDRA